MTMPIGRLMFMLQLLTLGLAYAGLVRSKGRRRVGALMLAIGLGVSATCLRPTYFQAKWQARAQFDEAWMMRTGRTIDTALGNGYRRDDESAFTMVWIESGMSRRLRSHQSAWVRFNAALVLCNRPQLSDFTALKQALGDPDFYVRLASATCLWRHNTEARCGFGARKRPCRTDLATYIGLPVPVSPGYDAEFQFSLPTVPNGDGEHELWRSFITKVRHDFGGGQTK